MKPLGIVAITAVCFVLGMSAAMVEPAHAGRKSCAFIPFNHFSQEKASASFLTIGRARKQGTACKRAKNKCLRKLRRAWKKGNLQQFACLRTGT